MLCFHFIKSKWNVCTLIFLLRLAGIFLHEKFCDIEITCCEMYLLLFKILRISICFKMLITAPLENTLSMMVQFQTAYVMKQSNIFPNMLRFRVALEWSH